ncbi:hypothetical protein [Pedobacter namyangjuensis]|uniref:hypothetical protein n=1 Tax=Pedobacter namyangjuensis TaxID=600626 RepID=UPI000DE4DE10|nr:hypothetical protein [Pedobacter namyangjuensis]
MEDLRESYNSFEGNGVIKQLDKIQDIESKFVVLSYTELNDFFNLAISASQEMPNLAEGAEGESSTNEIKAIYQKYFYDKASAIEKINATT